MGAMSSSIGFLHHRRLPVTWTSSREDRGNDFDCIREQFLDLYYLNTAQSVSVRI